MKKYLSLLLAAVMLLSVMPALSVTAGGASPVVYLQNFDGSTVTPGDFTNNMAYDATKTDTDGFTWKDNEAGFSANNYVAVDSASFANDPTYKNALEWRLRYPGKWSSFTTDIGAAPSVAVDGDRLEVEFDIKRNNFRTASTGITFFMVGTNGGSRYFVSTAGKIGPVDGISVFLNGEEFGTIPGWTNVDAPPWCRLKFVYKKTDITIGGTGYVTKELVAIYADGVNCMTYHKESSDPLVNRAISVAYTSSAGTAVSKAIPDVTGFRFEIGDKKYSLGSYGIYLDNICISQYNTEAGTPAPDRSALAGKVRSTYTWYAGKKTEYPTEMLAGVKTAADNAWVTYNNSAATQADFDAAILSIDNAVEDFQYLPTKVYGENYAGGSVPEYYLAGSPVLAVDAVTFAADPATGNALVMRKVVESGVSQYPRFGINFDNVCISDSADPAKDAGTVEGVNAYLETEFDIRIDKTTQNTAIFFNDATNSVRVFCILIGSGGNVNVEYDDNANPKIESTLTGVTYDYTKFNRFKFVMQLTDQNGDAVQKVCAIYLNGVNILPEPMAFTNFYGGSNAGKPGGASVYINRLYFSPSKIVDQSDYALYIDNVAINKYNLKTPASPSPVADKFPLAGTMRAGANKLAAAQIGINVTADIYNAFAAAIDAAKTIYNNPYVTKSEVNAANDTLYQAYAGFAFKNESASIGEIYFEDSEGIEASGLTNGGKITRIAVTKKAEYGFDGALFVAVYDSSGNMLKAGFADEVLKDLAAGEETDIPVNVALPPNVSGCTVKVILVNDIQGLMPVASPHIP